MSAAELPIPAEVFADVPPITDEDLDRYFDAVDRVAETMEVDEAAARQVIVSGETLSYPHAVEVARWTIADDGTAAWAAAKWADATGEIAALRVQADEWAARINTWFVQASRRPARTAAHMEERLADYGLRIRAETGRATVPLPSATIRTTDSKPKVEVVDDEIVAAWADQIPAGALAAKLTDGEVLVRRPAKVYVTPLRKFVRIERKVIAVRWLLTLGCGHEQLLTISGDDVGDTALPGAVHCVECPVDPIEGEDTVVRILGATPEEILDEDYVVGLDGEPVPGVAVKPGEITAKVVKP